jgi:hypothetical protein
LSTFTQNLIYINLTILEYTNIAIDYLPAIEEIYMRERSTLFIPFKFIFLSLIFTYQVSSAGVVDSVDLGYITTESAPYIAGETYFSTLFTDTNKVTSNGAISWVESDVVAPGFSLVNDDEIDMSNCFMTSGTNPDDGTIKQCSDPFQTSKRIKLNTTKPGSELDLVFDVSSNLAVANTYRILEKYLNVTDLSISDFTIELGFGTSENFVPAPANIGLDFSDNMGNIWMIETVTGDVNSKSLDALFPFGLFGEAATDPNHDVDGYFDPTDRARFTLSATRGIMQSTGISANYYDLVGDFMTKSQVLTGYFFDHDSDTTTDPLTIAHLTDLGWISSRTPQFWIDVATPTPPLNGDGTIETTTIDAWAIDPLYTSGPIEDLGNLNLNYYVSVGDISLWPNYDINTMSAQFTIRISSKESVIFKDGFEE